MTWSPTAAHELKENFLQLLDSELDEQQYQDYLEKNTALIPREFLQNHGVHFDLVVRKLSLAKDYTPDFFYLAKSSADWHLVLVELEKPQSRYFKNAKNDLHPEFLAGLDQIARWRAWFDNRANREGFIGGTIDPIRVPASMRGNPCHIKYVLVHGRRREFEDNDVRKGLIRAREADDFRIISYDSLTEALHSKGHLYVGVRKNECFEIVSPNFVSESIFSWMNPSFLRITDALREDLLHNRSSRKHYRPSGGLVLDHVLPQLGKCGE